MKIKFLLVFSSQMLIKRALQNTLFKRFKQNNNSLKKLKFYSEKPIKQGFEKIYKDVTIKTVKNYYSICLQKLIL